jgi:cysteine desulfurase/selenocysteine lyase
MMSDRIIYFDNAATSFPKPSEVLDGMIDSYRRVGVSPGRGGYDLATEAEDLVTRTRLQVARFFGAPDPDRVVFTSNATDALNLALLGMLAPGDHVVSTRLEHNSVLRPLFHLKQLGWINYDLVPFDEKGFVDPDRVAGALRSNTRLVVVSHASNVLGTVQPVAEIGRVCAERSVPLLIDAAQSAGQVPIDMAAWHVSAAAFTGHKALMGPSGIGGLVCSPDLQIKSTRFGGTGLESRSPVHTQTFPHRLEAGTLNLLGIIGLSLGLDLLQRAGIAAIRQREMRLVRRLHEGLAGLKRITLYTQPSDDRRVPLLLCNVEGMSPSDVGTILDGDYGIAVRTGLHCAPLVHADLGTDPRGAVRFSIGFFNQEEEVDTAVAAMADISHKRGEA